MGAEGDEGQSVVGVRSGLIRRVPWWGAAALGVAAIGVGVAITTKPFTSLGVLVGLVAAAFILVGVAELTSGHDRLAHWAGLGWVAVGVAIAAWPGLTVRSLALIAGVSLIAGALPRIVSGIRGGPDGRVVPLFSGVSRAIFGVLALSWPDVTVLVLALLVGPAMMLFGIGQVAGAIRHRDEDRSGGERRRLPSTLRIAGATISLAAALGLLAVSAAIHDSTSEPDAFYDAPNDVPDRPGQLVRHEAFSQGIPDGATAWRILYTTTRDDATPAIASAIVLTAKARPPGPRPVIAWAHGTTGYSPKCAPSLLKAPFAAGAMPALDEVVTKGWVVVATDYVGLGTPGPHPYLIGDPEGRSVLDAVRSARQLDEVQMESRTVVWGHSQGGGAALWTGILAPTYAPDADVIGVAALAPATRLPPLFDAVKDTPVGKIMGSYVVSAYSAVYPDVRFDDYVRPAARVLARETADRCLSGPEALVSVGTALGDEPYFTKSPATGPLGARLAENIPTGTIEAPLMIAQGLTDALVQPAEQQTYVSARCASGQQLEYRTYAGLDHVGVVLNPSSALRADLIEWTEARLRGETPRPGCTTTER